MAKYLDASGLTTLWEHSKGKFADLNELSNIPAFDSAISYGIGDEVRYTDGKFYRFKVNHTGAWVADDASAFAVYEDTQSKLDLKANKNGYYSTLVSGAAENLVGNSAVSADFYYRISGGNADIATGAATVQSFIGNTIAWNQMVNPTDSSVEIYASRSYLFNDGGVYKFITTDSTGITTATDASNNTHYYLSVDPSDNLFDLSRMYGTGNEPTDVSTFTDVYPLRYYSYNAGELVSFNPAGIHTVGFNQWDEEWEIGMLDASGNNVTSTTAIRSKNNISIPKTSSKYYVNCPDGSFGYICFFDANNTFLGSYNTPNVEINIPSNTAYAKFSTNATYGAAYKDDICLNFAWSGYRDGEYEKHWAETLSIDVKSITGKPLDSSVLSSVIFPHGLLSAGSVHDELYETKAIKRVGYVDLGSLTWSTYTGSLGYTSFISTISDANHGMNLSCSKYDITNISSNTRSDKTIFFSSNYFGTKKISIYDTNYATASQFKTAMSGVYLYYELETSIEYTLDTSLDMSYRVDDFGTESVMSANVSSINTTGFSGSIKYALNAADTIRNLQTNYVSTYQNQGLDETRQAYARQNIGLGEYENKADKDGIYPDLVAGNLVDAKNSGTQQVIGARRSSCGNDSITDDGYAQIKKLYGNTLVFNQLLKGISTDNYDVTSTVSIVNESFHFSRNTTGYYDSIDIKNPSISLVAEHKYYISAKISNNTIEASDNGRYLCFTTVINSASIKTYFNQSDGRTSNICTCSSENSGLICQIGYASNYSSAKWQTGTFDVNDIIGIDLTQMFGAGNEPSTVEEFKQLFPQSCRVLI